MNRLELVLAEPRIQSIFRSEASAFVKSPYYPLFKRGTEGDLDLASLELSTRNSIYDKKNRTRSGSEQMQERMRDD